MMGNRYEINISLGGSHWGRVVLDGIGHTPQNAIDKAQVLDVALRMWRRDRGQTDLFTVTLTRYTETGRELGVW